MSKKTTKLPGRELPPKFSVVTTTGCFFKFRPWMRVKILFGYNLHVAHRLFSVNSPGQVRAQFQERLTKTLTPEDFVSEVEQEATRLSLKDNQQPSP